MSFTLRWKNPNAVPTVVNVYRDTKDISPSALPTPLATLSNGETEYRDTTAVPGSTYYYLVTVTANGKTVVGVSQKYTIAVKRGIGPSTFITGDDRLGYLGPVPYDEQWGPQQMPAGYLSMFPGALTDRVALHKFSRNGKILYLLSTPGQFPAMVNWASVYQGGLVYGTDDVGPEGGHGTLPPTIQDAKIIHNGDTYRMRLPRGLTTSSEAAAFAFNESYNQKDHDAIAELTGFCEFNDLLYAMVVDVPAKQRWANWWQFSSSYIGSTGVQSNNNYYLGGTLCMEHDTGADRVLHRGLFNYIGSAVSQVSAIQKINYVSPSQIGRYLPIFELVE